MEFLVAAHTDVGIRKSENQDSLLVKVADTIIGKVCFVAVCDGMGGLAKGELASATVIRELDEWFCSEFPDNMVDFESIQTRFQIIISELNGKIANYGKSIQISLGTTLTAMLFAGNRYLIAHVGDSRAYKIDTQITVLTRDQTVVAREIERGRLTPEQAELDPRRNVLLQCIGASNVLEPDFYISQMAENTVYMLCSDGFRHEITEQEIYSAFEPNVLNNDENIMKRNLVSMVECCKNRREQDNITAVLIKTI